MTARTLDYPLGRSLIPALLLRRRRVVPAGAQLYAQINDQVRPDQVIAEAQDQGAVTRILAGLAGRVVETQPGQSVTIEGTATLLQGVVGVGEPVAGPLAFLPHGESLAVVPIPRGAIIVYPHRAPLTLFQRAAVGGAVGVIASSASALEFEAFARADLTLFFDGLTPTLTHFPLTVLLTEGLGDTPMDQGIFQLLLQRANDVALLTGHTQPRLNQRPELLLPLPLGAPTVRTPLDNALTIGAYVAVIAGPQRGARGQLLYLFGHQQPGPAGLWAHSALVRLDSGATLTQPLSALDRIG
ncbi:MAG: hypothetical protein ABI068_15205 [Ktedonobacterales bacterium]